MDRDTLFAGNPELYYTIGNASTMISAMALPLSGILKGTTGAAKFKTIAVDGGRILIGNVAEDKAYDVIYQSTDSRILAMLGSNVVEGVLSGNPANSSVSEIGDVARKTDIEELGDNLIDLQRKAVDGVSNPKIDYNLIKDYVRDIESRTRIKLPKNQVEELKNALRNKEYSKLTPKETAKHRNEFNKIKSNLIEEWERNTGQKWPTYTEDVISPNTGKVVRKAGDKYDAHHVIENSFGGENEWWNIHPAKFPNEHQSGIHGTGSPANKLFKGGNK